MAYFFGRPPKQLNLLRFFRWFVNAISRKWCFKAPF